MRKILWLEVMLVLVWGSCKGSIPQGVTQRAEENQIREAVFRYQFTHYSEGSQVFFISFPSETDPSDAFMIRFSNNQPPVRKASQAKEDIKGIFDVKTGEKGPILKAGEIKWLDRDTVEAISTYYCGFLCANGDIYRVKRKGDKWAVENKRTEWVS